MTNSTTPYPNGTSQHLDFSLDGKSHAGEFDQIPAGSEYAYNVSLFSSTSLAYDKHILTLTIKDGSFVLLDYFVYTGTPIRYSDPLLPLSLLILC